MSKGNRVSDERLDEMLIEVKDEMESAIADAEYDQNPQLAIDAVGEFDLAEMHSILTELQAHRSKPVMHGTSWHPGDEA